MADAPDPLSDRSMSYLALRSGRILAETGIDLIRYTRFRCAFNLTPASDLYLRCLEKPREDERRERKERNFTSWKFNAGLKIEKLRNTRRWRHLRLIKTVRVYNNAERRLTDSRKVAAKFPHSARSGREDARHEIRRSSVFCSARLLREDIGKPKADRTGSREQFLCVSLTNDSFQTRLAKSLALPISVKSTD